MAVKIDHKKCCYCGGCVSICPEDAIRLTETTLTISKEKCSECELCMDVCPVGALEKNTLKE